MVSKGLLVRLMAQSGKNDEVEEFLMSALPMVRQEVATTAWFAIRFGYGHYGVFDVFADDAGREAHLNGPVAKALKDREKDLLAEAPVIQTLDILAYKLPHGALVEPDKKGLLLTFIAKEGHADDVEQFLRDAKPLVDNEPETNAWFAIHLENGEYGIFDTFPDNGGRLKHLVGRVPQELVKNSMSLLGSFPDMDMLSILEEKVGDGE